jgi:hypothetical protein
MKLGQFDVPVDERKEYKALKVFPDLVLFGDAGEKLMGLRSTKKEGPLETETKVDGLLFDVNFEVYIFSDDAKDEFEGPISFLDFLSSLKVTEVIVREDSE